MSKYKQLYNLAIPVLLLQAAGAWIGNLWSAKAQPVAFDDAYMFARYAFNIRHGLGISWNLDGQHTYGETSLLWGFVVLAFSFLPIGTWTMLILGSWLCSAGAALATAWAVACSARSSLLSSTWKVLPLVVLPLTATRMFLANQVNGMETMMAAMLASLFMGLALQWRRGVVRPEIAGLAGVLLFLARPEAALVVVLFPLLLFVLLPGADLRIDLRISSLVRLLGVFLLGVAGDLAFSQMYFHSPVPLSFYMKGRHAYEGYAEVWHPELLMMAFLGACQLYLAAMLLLARRRHWRMIVCCLVPLLGVFAYLGTVTQIMGFNSRYYAPYFGFIVVPALLVVDSWLEDRQPAGPWPRKTLLVRGVATGSMMALFILLSSQAVLGKIRHLERDQHVEYAPAILVTAATVPLPHQDWSEMMISVTDRLIAPLPAGATVTSTEVGYLGARASQLNVIDLAGLNDTQIAKHGFDVDALLARKPDLLWMPNLSYTYQRGLIFSNPTLLQRYDVYAGAANFGLGVRKDSPYRAQIERQMKVYWDATYPGYRMEDYRVTAASWSGAKSVIVGD